MKSHVGAKSSLSDYNELAQSVYIDACAKCTADVSDLRDLKTIKYRIENEGLSFLTITMPSFARDFESSLANEAVDPTFFRGFRKNGAIPALLQGMLGHIFNRETGRKHDEDTKDISTIIESVRQICLTFKKIEIDCTPERVAAALVSYTKIEQDFQLFQVPSSYSDFIGVSRVLWDNALGPIIGSRAFSKHGPGATSENASGNQKFIWRYWHERLEPYFPIIENGLPLGIPHDDLELKNVTFLSVDNEIPVRVISVPKTLKSPRIIAIEPCCMQYTQQGVRRMLYDAIESSEFAGGHVNFRDQSVNQKLAIIASSTGQLATIDLSDASDRVPYELALEMFRSNPDLMGMIDACRSTRAKLPDGSIIADLKKFASMGSALCFPVEAMYFYTICVVAALQVSNLPVNRANCKKVCHDIHVYGDDIIVPLTYADAVLSYLQKYNCKVNANKTFLKGNFRESCGVDAYAGYVVSPTYIRKVRPKNRRMVSEIVSWVATANLFYKKGYWKTAHLMFHYIEKLVGPLPYLSDTHPGLGRTSFLGFRSHQRWNQKLQCLEIKVLVPEPTYRTDKLNGYGALTKSLRRLEERDASPDVFNDSQSWKSLDDHKDRWEVSDDKHLERSALTGSVTLKSRWLPSTL